MRLPHNAFEHILEVEGGYGNDPDDPGGETKYGISKRAYPGLDIGRLTKPQAYEIYDRDYWAAANCDMLPYKLGFALFDAVVNHGRRRGTKLLQAALGVKADGVIGPITSGTAMGSDAREVVVDFLARRGMFYAGLAKRKGQSKFLRGWLRRLFILHKNLYR